MTAETPHPDSFWGAAIDTLTAQYPLLTPEVVTQWQIAAREIGQKFSQNPRTRLSALVINPDNELVAVGVNNFIKGVPLSPENLASSELRYAFGLCAEQGATTACSSTRDASVAENILITPFFPCENCAKAVLASEIAALVTDPQELSPGLMERWGRRLEVSRTLIDQARSPEPVLVVAARVPATARLELEIDRLPLEGMVTGVAFSRPVPYDSLRSRRP